MGAPGEQGENQQINDYSQHFVDTGLRPQNYLRDAVLTDRCVCMHVCVCVCVCMHKGVSVCV